MSKKTTDTTTAKEVILNGASKELAAMLSGYHVTNFTITTRVPGQRRLYICLAETKPAINLTLA